MVDYKRILVPTDFSESSLAAIPHARRLALTFGAQVLLVHVLEQPPYLPYGFAVDETPIDEAPLIDKVTAHLDSIAAQFGDDVEVRALLTRGHPAETLARTAEEEEIDMIVISTRGHSPIERFFLGSVVDKVVRRATCPVVTIPTHG